MAGLAEEISLWIAKRLKVAGAKGVVVGLSGGVDSSVVAALAMKAPGIEALGLLMPCHSSPEDEEDARRIAEHLGIPTVRVDLTPAFDVLGRSLPSGDRIAMANIKPRLRMITLYHFAKLRGYLVAGTSNKSELMVGYFTKYGDGGADILPLGNLLKREVRALAQELGLPRWVIERTPSGGLWPGQTDEGEMGITYAKLDEALAAIEAGEESRIDQATLTRVKRMIAASQHKRDPVPRFEPGRG